MTTTTVRPRAKSPSAHRSAVVPERDPAIADLETRHARVGAALASWASSHDSSEVDAIGRAFDRALENLRASIASHSR